MASETNDAFAAARELFPHVGKVIYFNSASYGPYSTRLKEALDEHIEARAEAVKDRTVHTFDARSKIRRGFAAMIGAHEREIGIGLNTSFGLNVAAYGLPLEAGDEVLVSDVEFPAIIYTFRAAAEARGITMRFVPSTERRFDVEKFERAITDKTRVLALSWVQFFNGYKNDLARLREICRAHDLFFVVDGIQGMGVEPLDVKELGIDIFTTGCQKWMLAPQGCGFFYVADEIRDRMTLPYASWLGVDWQMNFSDLFKFDLPFVDSAEKFDLGYYVELNLLGMKVSADLFTELGIENIQRHNYALIDRLVAYIRENAFYAVTSSMEPKHRSSIVTFACDDVQALHKKLLAAKIICVQREGSIRISVHLFNNESDIDRLIEVLDEFAKTH